LRGKRKPRFARRADGRAGGGTRRRQRHARARAYARANALPPAVLKLRPVLEGESVNKVRVPENAVHLVRRVKLEDEAERHPLRHRAEHVFEAPHGARPKLRARAAWRVRGATRDAVSSALVPTVDVVRINLHLAPFVELVGER
jgi:hypothetical protein